MTISLSDNNPRISYTVNAGATQTSFTVPFEFFDLADLNVYVDGTQKTATTHYTVASGGSGSTGTISLSVTGASGNSTVVITRDIDLARTTDFPTSGSFNIAALNTELDKVTAQFADQKDDVDRSLRLQDSDAAASMELPLKDARKGTVLGFNATTGVPEAGPTIANVNSLAAITTNINTVSGISSNVTTVAGISSNVTTVAGIASNVTSVAGNASNINAVVSNASNINTVAGNISNVNAVGAKSSLITSDFVSDLNTVAVTDVINDLNTLATSDFVADLNLAATSDFVSDLNTMATSTNVNNLGTVAGAVSNVNTVAGIASNVSTVAGIASNVTAVAGDATDIGNVSGSIGNVNTVAGAISNVNSVAGNASNINSVAGNSSNINSAVSNASNINSAVSNASNINTVAGAITNVNNVAGSIANVNTVAGNLSGVNSFAERYRVGSSDPTSSLDEGDLFYNTTSNSYKFYNGSSWNTVNVSGIGSLADDSSPQLGGNLDLNSNDITGTGNINVTGTVTADGLDVQGDGTISGGSRLTISDIADINNDGIRLDDNTTGRFNNLTQDTSGNFKIQHWTGSAWQNNFTLSTTGSVGIGTSLPASPTGFGTGGILHLKGSTGNDASIVLEGLSGSGGRQEIGASGGALQFYRGAATGSMTESMRIDGSGNVLVGKTAVNSNAAGFEAESDGKIAATRDGSRTAIFNRLTSDGEIVAFRKDGSTVGSIGAKGGDLTLGTGAIGVRFEDSSNAIVPFDTSTAGSTGNDVDLGKSSVRFNKGYFNDSVRTRYFVGVDDSNTYIEMGGSDVMKFVTGGSERGRFSATGSLLVAQSASDTPGISNTTQGVAIGSTGRIHSSVNGAFSSFNRNSSDGGVIQFHREGNKVGEITVNSSSTAYGTSSDYRLKTAVEYDWDATARLKQLRPARFEWIADGDDAVPVDGFLAHEVQSVVPEAITGTKDEVDADGNPVMQGIDQSKIVPLLVKTIQELEARIAALEAN